MGLKNVIIMLPFCRTVEEVERVQEVMSSFGLVRGEEGLGSLSDVRNPFKCDDGGGIFKICRRIFYRKQRFDTVDPRVG